MVESSAPVWIYDTTLRDGAQREGLSFSLEDKIRIAHQLDQLGIPFIEGGWPGANPKDVQFFWQLREQQPLKTAQLVAFCSTRRPGRSAADDELLQAILAAGTHWVTLFGKSWDLHVTEGLKTSLDENLAMIADSIQYLRSQHRRVIYDAEHWFDGYRQNPDYALKTLEAALDAGAEWLVLCDTNGGTLPHDISAIVADCKPAFFITEDDLWEEASHVLDNNHDCKVIFLGPEQKGHSAWHDLLSKPRHCPVTATASEEIALLAYTSGSTGEPKGVMLSHFAINSNVEGAGQVIHIRDRKSTRLNSSHRT